MIQRKEGRPGEKATTPRPNQTLAADVTCRGSSESTPSVGITPTEWQRREWSHSTKVKRRVSAELDALLAPAPVPPAPEATGCACGCACLIGPATDVDWYRATGLTMGMLERAAAGRALLERAA